MALSMRLSRGGSKKRPYYKIVVADARAPRDGNYIERLGDYNPLTKPASIHLDVDKAVLSIIVSEKKFRKWVPL